MNNGAEIYGSNTVLSTTTSGQVIDTFSSSAFGTAKYIIQAINGTDIHSTEVMLMQNGTVVYLTEYANTYTTPLMSVDSTISGGDVNLTVTPFYINTNIDFTRTSLVKR